MKKERAWQAIELPFYKIHGAGNDMVVFETQDLPLSAKEKPVFMRKISHRTLGIGCDQVLEVCSTREPLAINIWNRDGTLVEMCANGSRAFLYLASCLGWIEDGTERVPLFISGSAYEGILAEEGYELCLGETKVKKLQTLNVKGKTIPYTEVNVGNPHAVIFVNQKGPDAKANWKAPKDFSYLNFGPLIETHKKFPQKTNVEFVRSWKMKSNAVHAEVEAWERGAGATLSCGSGAVAVAAVLREMTGKDLVYIKMTDFTLRVRFEGKKAFLGGPSAVVCAGKYFAL